MNIGERIEKEGYRNLISGDDTFTEYLQTKCELYNN